MATAERLAELQRLKEQGKDIGGARRTMEQLLFDEADERIDAFWAERRSTMEGIIAPGETPEADYQVIISK